MITLIKYRKDLTRNLPLELRILSPFILLKIENLIPFNINYICIIADIRQYPWINKFIFSQNICFAIFFNGYAYTKRP